MAYEDWDYSLRAEDEEYAGSMWEHDNEPDYQAQRDEETVSMLYDEYVEQQFNDWSAYQEQQAEEYFDLLAYIDIIEDTP